MLLKRILTGLLCAVIVAGAVYFGCTFRFFDRALSAETQEQFRESISLPANFALTASVDCDCGAHNSLQATRQAIADGAYAMELNVTFDKSGTPYLADGEDYLTPQSVPLETVLRKNLDYPYLRYLFNLKNYTSPDTLFTLLQDTELLERVILCGFTTETLTQQHAKFSRFKLCLDVDTAGNLNDSAYCQQLRSTAFNLGASFLRCSASDATQTLSDMLRSSPLGLILDHVDTEYDMYYALSLNPRAVVTDHPKALFTLLFENDYLRVQMENQF